MSAGEEYLLLYGIFTRLREAGIPLQVRDYLEGLNALQLNGGLEPFQLLSGVGIETSRVKKELSKAAPTYRVRMGAELVWLCQVLWARSQDERNLVERVITTEIGLPPPRRVLELCEALGLGEWRRWAEEQTDPPPIVAIDASTWQETRETDAKKTEAASSQEQEGISNTQIPGEEKHTIIEDEEETIPIEVVTEGEGDLSLPQLARSTEHVETFLPLEEQVIPPLWLVSLWRRLFVPVRRNGEGDIDVATTVREAARSGMIVAPVTRSRRRNTARLLLLVDTSEAMAPWRQFENVLVESLDPRISRLSAVEIGYFQGVPGRQAFRDRNLHNSELLENVLRRNSGHSLLVVGEAGVIQSRNYPVFEERLENLLSRAREFNNKPLIWVNPMPQRRWRGSLMDRLYDRPDVYALELNPEALLRGVDLMRGVSN